MSITREELRAFIRQVDPRQSLGPDDPRYVSLDELRGSGAPSCVEMLVRNIENLDESCQLFTGFPGTGKTTELHRLEARLAAARDLPTHVIYIDFDDYWDSYSPPAVTDVLRILAYCLDREATLAEGGDPEKKPGYVRRFFDLLTQTDVKLKDVGFDVYGTKLMLELKDDSSFRQRAHAALEGRFQQFAGEARASMEDSVVRLRKARGAHAQRIVVVADSIEKLQPLREENRQAMEEAVEMIFVNHADHLRLPCHVVFTFPIWLRYRRTDIGAKYDGEPWVLPMVKIAEPGGAPVPAGLLKLTELVARRLDLGSIFGADQDRTLTPVLRASGGYPGNLLRMVRSLLIESQSFPVDPGDTARVITRLAETYSRALFATDLDILAAVAETHALPRTGEERLARFLVGVDARSLQLYPDDRDGYDVHPLLRDTVLEHARAAHAATAVPPNPPRPPATLAAPVALTPDMCVSIVAENYRALRRVRWAIPRGVSALVGPNGSGKTTLLDVPELLRHTLTHDARKAVDDRGGPGSLRSVQADRTAPVILGVDLDDLAWTLDLSPRGTPGNPLSIERASIAGAVAFDRATSGVSAMDARPFILRFSEQPEGAAFRPLIALLEGYRLYGAYDLGGIRVNGSLLSSDEHLHPDGRNIFSLLRNWRDRAETRPRWEFVLASLKEAFPDTFDLDFDMAGQTVFGLIVAPQPNVRIPTYFAANGWLVALLHLAAVASTSTAGVVAIDEMENGLHPYAIRALIEAMRSWSAQTGISIVLATHSPVVLDQFKEAPDHILVMETGREPAPTPLDDLHDPEWLAHFSLGDLYAHDEFGAQHKDGDRVA